MVISRNEIPHQNIRVTGTKITNRDICKMEGYERSVSWSRQHCALNILEEGWNWNNLKLEEVGKDICDYLLKHRVVIIAENLLSEFNFPGVFPNKRFR